MTRAEIVLKHAEQARAEAWAAMTVAYDAAHFLPEGDPRQGAMLRAWADASNAVGFLESAIKFLSGKGETLPTFDSQGGLTEMEMHKEGSQ